MPQALLPIFMIASQAIGSALPILGPLAAGTSLISSLSGGGGGGQPSFSNIPAQSPLSPAQNASNEQQRRAIDAATVRRMLPGLIDQTGGSLTTPEYGILASQQAGTYGNPGQPVGWMGALDTLNQLPGMTGMTPSFG